MPKKKKSQPLTLKDMTPLEITTIHIEEKKKHYFDDLVEIKHEIDMDEGEVLGDVDLDDKVAETLALFDSKVFTAEEKLQNANKLLTNFYFSQIKARIIVEGIFAKYAVTTGKILLGMKKLVKQELKQSWEDYANKHVKISPTQRRNYMRLASRDDIEHFLFLSVDRCLQLISEVENQAEEELSIGKFLLKNGIMFETYRDKKDFAKLKEEIDTMLVLSKFKRNGLKVEKNLVKNIVNKGLRKKIDKKATIDKLISMRNPNRYLRSIDRTNGKAEEPTGEVQIMTFSHLAARIVETVDKTISDDSYLLELDERDIQAVQNSLQLLTEKFESLGS